jgi:hypothetical protein
LDIFSAEKVYKKTLKDFDWHKKIHKYNI